MEVSVDRCGKGTVFDDAPTEKELSTRPKADCLKDLKIFVPEAVIMGNAATLSCQYDLEQAALYSVRWYFGTEEFYRYVPKESPPTLVFPVSGINVDMPDDIVEKPGFDS
uniref:Ig-like domain-containing protein n=1 Tax=Glossina austeni TaxID=7395 RepID=A0A1A9VQ97_GLOAU